MGPSVLTLEYGGGHYNAPLGTDRLRANCESPNLLSVMKQLRLIQELSRAINLWSSAASMV